MSYVSPPKGGSDVQDALNATQRNPDYLMGKNVKQSQINNISDYVTRNLGNNVQKRFKEHR